MSALLPNVRALLVLAVIAPNTLLGASAGAQEVPLTEAAVGEASVAAAPAQFPSSPLRTEQTGRSGLSPGESFGVGVFATVAPAVIAFGSTTNPQARVDSRPLALLLASTGGIVFGPAIGLASGGRGDLAGRGLGIRVLGLGIFTLAGAGAIASAFDDSGTTGSVAGLLAVSAIGGGLTVVSALHDLAITPSAVAEGRPSPRASLGVRPDGMLAVSVRF